MILLGYYAFVTAGAFIGGKILSACLSDENSKPKENENRVKHDTSSYDSDYEPQALRDIEWGVLI